MIIEKRNHSGNIVSRVDIELIKEYPTYDLYQVYKIVERV